MAKTTKQLSVTLELALFERIRDFRFANRIESMSETIALLVTFALDGFQVTNTPDEVKQTDPPTAEDLDKS